MRPDDTALGEALKKGERLPLQEPTGLLIDAAGPIRLAAAIVTKGGGGQLVDNPFIQDLTGESRASLISSEGFLRERLTDGKTLSLVAVAQGVLPGILVTVSEPRRHFAIIPSGHAAAEIASLYLHATGLRMKASGDGSSAGLDALLRVLA